MPDLQLIRKHEFDANHVFYPEIVTFEVDPKIRIGGYERVPLLK